MKFFFMTLTTSDKRDELQISFIINYSLFSSALENTSEMNVNRTMTTNSLHWYSIVTNDDFISLLRHIFDVFILLYRTKSGQLVLIRPTDMSQMKTADDNETLRFQVNLKHCYLQSQQKREENRSYSTKQRTFQLFFIIKRQSRPDKYVFNEHRVDS